ncbi:coiled-coil domain-containing protein 57-like [Clavelina lepadiformis]|uniref:coiled-coil domain-containing protein 57-like n=1 Tax=Clavelina lepadiformis TaxID=159417 RepID=UPI0040436552
MNVDDVALKDIEALAAQKEQEWQSAVTIQIKALRETLNVKTQECNDVNKKFLKLKEDFKYNLKLLNERDQELTVLDEATQKLKISESNFLAEISDLHIRVDNTKEQLCREKQAKTEMEMHYKQRLIDQQTKTEIFRTAKNNEVEEVMSELRRMKLQHEQKISQLECELESQKVELVHEFEGLMKAREKEFITKEEEFRSKESTMKMKNKLLSKEMEFIKEKQQESTGAVQVAEETTEALSKKLQQTEWELADMSALKNARILELESQVKNLRSMNDKIEQDFQQRRIQLDKDVRAKQANIMAAKQANLDREKSFEDQIRKLSNELECAKLETNRALWDSNDMKRNLEAEIEKLNGLINDLNARLEEAILAKSKSVVAKDTEIITQSKRVDILRNENVQLKKNIEKYKEELANSVKREEELEQSKTQLKLNWKRKCEDVESKTYNKTEDLASNLVQAKTAAEAKTKMLENDLKEVNSILDAASHERDVAIHILNQHHLINDFNVLIENTDDGHHTGNTILSQRMQDLQDRNEQLRVVIKQMTTDMQVLKLSQGESKTSSMLVDGNKFEDRDAYLESLEKEILELKRDKRRLEDKLPGLQESNKSHKSNTVMVDEPVKLTEVSGSHPTIQNHINELNKTIASLEAEKMEFRANVQKLQANLNHQLLLSQQHEREAKDSSLKVQQLEYEATATKHRTDQETKQLKDRISALSLNLAEAQREADEYYRGGIKNNMRAMELSGKISQLTVDMASNTPWVSNHVQAKLMQDLQNEVTSLRKKLAHAKQHSIMAGRDGAAAGNKELHHKLKMARLKIRSLIQEKNLLLEAGNKMRAELMSFERNKEEPKTKGSGLSDSEVKNIPEKLEESSQDNRLQRMEKLQYQLTKQQLAFAQRRTLPESGNSSTEESSTGAKEIAPVLLPTSVPNAPKQPMMYSMSSIDDSSMKEVWKMLDQAPSSPSIMGDDDPLKSQTAPNQGASSPRIRSSSPIQEQRPKKLISRKAKPKIRNYNVKDDVAFRGRTGISAKR